MFVKRTGVESERAFKVKTGKFEKKVNRGNK